MTAEELFSLPTNDRLDRRLICGRLVEREYPFRSPAHASVIATLSALLKNWEKSPDGTGWAVFGYGCPYRLMRGPDTVICFDATIIARALVRESQLHRQFIDGWPTLAIEVVDHSDPRDAVAELAEHGISCGIPLLWLIDPVEEIVEVHRPGCGSVVLDREDELVADFVGPRFSCSVAEIFE